MSAVKPSRKTPPSPLRRISQGVLAAGAVLSAAAAFGPVWAIRIGVGVAIVAGVVACGYAWRELSQARREHAKKLHQLAREQSVALSKERAHNGSVVDTLAERAQAARVKSDQQRVVIAGLQSEVSTLHGDIAFLRGEIKQREAAVSSLQQTVDVRDGQIAELRQDLAQAQGIAEQEVEGEAEIHGYPRRALADGSTEWAALPTADELWTAGDHPTVVDLKTLETAFHHDHRDGDQQAERKSS